MQVVLFEPEIPQNTGSIARTCAALRCPLHLIEPLGFAIDEKKIRRAGLDYWPLVQLKTHPSFAAFLEQRSGDGRLLMLSTKASSRYDQLQYRDSDVLVFGPESRGLPAPLLHSVPPEERLRIPMLEPGVRSLNLSNAVSIVLYEAMRQLGFQETQYQETQYQEKE